MTTQKPIRVTGGVPTGNSSPVGTSEFFSTAEPAAEYLGRVMVELWAIPSATGLEALASVDAGRLAIRVDPAGVGGEELLRRVVAALAIRYPE